MCSPNSACYHVGTYYSYIVNILFLTTVPGRHKRLYPAQCFGSDINNFNDKFTDAVVLIVITFRDSESCTMSMYVYLLLP